MASKNGKHYTIAPALAELPHCELGDLLELQGELKDLSEREAAKLRKSMSDKGIFVPFFVWPAPDGNKYLLDGHQRRRVLVQDGQGALSVPYVVVEANSLQDAKERLLVISSQYGRITQEGLDTFAFDLDETWMEQTVHFDALSFILGEPEIPDPQPQKEPELDSDHLVEIRCSHSALIMIQDTLSEWAQIDDITIDIS